MVGASGGQIEEIKGRCRRRCANRIVGGASFREVGNLGPSYLRSQLLGVARLPLGCAMWLRPYD